MAEELTRKQLQEQLEAAAAENAALRAKLEAKPTEPGLTESELHALRNAQAELDALKRAAPTTALPAVKPQLRPYQGSVKATEACHIGGQLRAKDDVFTVDLPCLWSDDPFVPVIVTGTSESGVPITQPHPNARRVDFRFRERVSVSTDLEPLRASAF